MISHEICRISQNLPDFMGNSPDFMKSATKDQFPGMFFFLSQNQSVVRNIFQHLKKESIMQLSKCLKSYFNFT